MKHTLLICLPLLVVMACQEEKKKSKVVVPSAPTNEIADLDGAPSEEVPNIPERPSTPENNNESMAPVPSVPVTPVPPVTPPAPPVTPPAPECATHVLDFDRNADGVLLKKGEKIKDQYKKLGVHIQAEQRLSNGAMRAGDAILFDSAERPNAEQKAKYKEIDCQYGNCFGFDADLMTPTNHKALIIAEHTHSTGDANIVSYPDDNSFGGIVTLTFAKPTSIIYVDLVNFQKKDSNIKLYSKDADGSSIEKYSQPIPVTAAGKMQNVTVNDHDYIHQMKVNLSGVGSIDNLKICIKN